MERYFHANHPLGAENRSIRHRTAAVPNRLRGCGALAIGLWPDAEFSATSLGGIHQHFYRQVLRILYVMECHRRQREQLV
jgi:hypothetical protein